MGTRHWGAWPGSRKLTQRGLWAATVAVTKTARKPMSHAPSRFSCLYLAPFYTSSPRCPRGTRCPLKDDGAGERERTADEKEGGREQEGLQEVKIWAWGSFITWRRVSLKASLTCEVIVLQHSAGVDVHNGDPSLSRNTHIFPSFFPLGQRSLNINKRKCADSWASHFHTHWIRICRWDLGIDAPHSVKPWFRDRGSGVSYDIFGDDFHPKLWRI